jgi:hypothetical protein
MQPINIIVTIVIVCSTYQAVDAISENEVDFSDVNSNKNCNHRRTIIVKFGNMENVDFFFKKKFIFQS